MQRQILIVEDNELNRELLYEILSAEYQVLEAENGQAALDVLEQNKDSIALILLDVMMPMMDGYTFLDHIKKDPELALIPVIVMTQSDTETDEVSALVHGATDFVPKPYRPQVILHRVASLIQLRETAAMVNQLQYDRLTGLYSMEFFCQKVREQLQESPDEDYSIVCSNIENFKFVNDAFGKQEGDRLLKDVAEISRSMVGSTGFCGRFTADHILCFQKREQEQRDREHFGNYPDHPLSPLMKKVVMRWGIYQITDRSIPVDQMCDRALLAANSIQGQYNRFFAVYDDALRSKLLREQAITDAMETALAEGQFVVYLQPKYSLLEERLAGTEALVRWIHPEWGFMSPGEFIPLFEKNGFIPKLDQYVWEQVCRLLRDWKEQGYPLLPVSVNVSRADVYQGDLVQTLQDLIRKYDVDPAYLHLEITESAYAENPGEIIATVAALRKLGFIVEMDDFGSGYSSLSMFSQMALDVLKLDMKFVQNEAERPMDQSILNDIISMAHRMHLNVVAEGVETRSQADRLRAIGCDYVQGYFFAKPMPVEEFSELLRTQPPLDPQAVPKTRRKMAEARTLLVADEDAGYRKSVTEIFAGQYAVLEASNAEEALACIESCEGHVSAVILSMTLPDDGATRLMQTLRRTPAYWEIPVLSTIPRGDRTGEMPLTLETDDFLCKYHPLYDLRRRIQRLMDISALHEQESILLDEASRDHLTGLFNRRGFQTAIASVRMEDLPLSVMLFDLDNLKEVNDTCGHDTGDRMIRMFADLLRYQTRTEDIQCRYGGDEFVVVLKRLNDEKTVMKKVRDICSAFRDRLARENISASCSVGVVLCQAGERPSAEMIEHADQALYRAKRNRGSCWLWSEKDE